MTERSVRVVLDGDVSKYNRAVLSAIATTKAFGNELDTSTDRTANLVQGLMAVGPVLVPIATAATPALAGLSNQLAMTAGAAGVAVIAFSGVGEALKAVNDFQIEPTAANFAKLEESMASLGPAGRDFVTYLQSIRPELQQLQDVAQEGMFPGMQVGLSELMTQLPQAERIVGQIAEAIGQLSAEAGTSLAGPRWEEFFDFLESEAKPTLMDMGRTVGNLADGFAQLWMAFGPTSANFSDSFLRMSQDFASWASSVDETQGFEDFLAYLEQTGPQVWDTLGALGNALLQVAEAAAPVGAAALPIIEALADTIAFVADSDAGPVLIATAAGISAISRAVMLYNVTQGSALATLLGGTTAGAAGRNAKDLRGSAAAYLDFGAALDKSGPAVGKYASTTDRLKASMGGVGRIVGGLGAIAFAASDLDDSLGLSNTVMLTLAGSLAGPWGAAAGAAIGITRDLGAATSGLSDALDAANKAADGGSIEQREAAMKALRHEVEKAATGEAGFGQRIAEWAENSNKALPIVGGLAVGIDRFTTSSSEAGRELSDLEKKHAVARKQADDQAFAEAGLGDAMANASSAARDQTSSLLRNIDALNARRDAVLQSLDGELAYEAAIDAAADAAKNGKDSVDSNTAAGRENLGLLYDLAGAWNNQTAEQQGAAGAAERARESFIDSAVGMDMERRAAEKLADQLLDIPPRVSTRFTLYGAPEAGSAMDRLLEKYNRLQSKTINIKVLGGTQVGYADGGLVRGPGGPRDDKVPALLSNGEYVVNAAATSRNLPALERMNARKFADGGLVNQGLAARPVASYAVTATPDLAGLEFSSSLKNARIEIGKDGLAKFVNGMVETRIRQQVNYQVSSERQRGLRGRG